MPILQKVQNVFKKDKEAEGTSEPIGTTSESVTPAFDNKKITVVYVLGGPGAGAF